MGIVVMGQQLDWMILVVFFNLSDYNILRFWACSKAKSSLLATTGTGTKIKSLRIVDFFSTASLKFSTVFHIKPAGGGGVVFFCVFNHAAGYMLTRSLCLKGHKNEKLALSLQTLCK